MKLLSRVQLFVTPWTVAHQAPLSMGFFQAWILEWVAIAPKRTFLLFQINLLCDFPTEFQDADQFFSYCGFLLSTSIFCALGLVCLKSITSGIVMTRPLGFQNRVLDPGVEILPNFSWIVCQTQDRHYSLYHSSLYIHLQSSVRLWFPRQVA